MKDANCIFCKIANGEIPSATLYEDDQFRVILDLNPAAKGHALVLPKYHYANLFGTRLYEGLYADGFNLVQNNGEKAGQTVFHFHMHLIPRYADDTVSMGWKPGSLQDEDKAQILDLFE